MTRKAICLLLAALFSAVAARSILAYSQGRNHGNGAFFWPAGSKITYTFNSNFACTPGTTCGPDKDQSLVRGAFAAAFSTLMNGMPQQNGKPIVTLVENNTTTTVNTNACDGINLITFTDQTDVLPDGVIAEARVFSAVQAGDVQCGNLQVTAIKNGQIIDVDMLFNTAEKFTTNIVADQVFDIQALATHEGGHWLGLGHSGIVSTVMSPYADSGTFSVRTLHSDDIASLLAIYSPGGPAISGQVTRGGTPVKGAHVVATDASTGRVVASALSDGSGNYSIMGLKASVSYTLYAEPLDGPVTLGNIDDMFQVSNGGTADFTMQVRSGNVTATSGNTAGVNFAVGNTPAFNLMWMGILKGSGATIGITPISIPRGRTSQIAIQGATGTTALSGLPTVSSPTIGIAAGDVALADPTIVVFKATPSAATPAGPVNLFAGGATTVSTGGVIVTANPGPPANAAAIGVCEAAACNTTSGPFYAPGSMVSIFGSDIIDTASIPPNTPGAIVINGSVIGVQAATIPVPTQVAGVSVNIGGQLAPLFFVGPGQINAMIPYELAVGGTYPITIITGPTSSTAAGSVTLTKSAPRIFRLNQVSADLGAILNRSRSNSLVDIAHPAKAGDVLEVYGEGLGLAKSASQIAITGLVYNDPNNLARAQDPITLSLGGMAVNIAYAGLAPCCVGLFQVDFTIPAGTPKKNTDGSSDLVLTTASGSDTVKVFMQ